MPRPWLRSKSGSASHEVEQCQHVGMERVFEVPLGGRQQRPKAAGGRVAHQNVELADLARDVLEHRTHVVNLTDVGLDDVDAPAQVEDLLSSFHRGGPRSDIIDDHVGPASASRSAGARPTSCASCQ